MDIPEALQKLNLAGVKELTQDTVKSQYRKLASKYHPDRIQNDQARAVATEAMKDINAARDFITDHWSEVQDWLTPPPPPPATDKRPWDTYTRPNPNHYTVNFQTMNRTPTHHHFGLTDLWSAFKGLIKLLLIMFVLAGLIAGAIAISHVLAKVLGFIIFGVLAFGYLKFKSMNRRL